MKIENRENEHAEGRDESEAAREEGGAKMIRERWIKTTQDKRREERCDKSEGHAKARLGCEGKDEKTGWRRAERMKRRRRPLLFPREEFSAASKAAVTTLLPSRPPAIQMYEY